MKDIVFWTIFIMAPLIAGIFIAYLCVTAPARRNERARLFLDLLETALRGGKSIERTIVEISDTHDRIVSVHFHLLAAHIEEGARLEHALVLTPRFLPGSVAEVIKIGARENTLEKLLPAARAMLTDVNSRMRGAMHYVIAFLVVVIPAMSFFLPMLSIFIWPKIKQILEDFEAPPPKFTMMVFENAANGAIVHIIFIGILTILFLMALAYVFGPRLAKPARFIFGSLPDRLAMMLPWRRYRAHRDFTAALAILLDANVQETHAIRLAAQATANDLFIQRADLVIVKLESGVPLPEALKKIEPNKEFQWRWTSALRAGKDFFAVLRGWHESLETRAFQREQAAAHLITSSIVLMNGVLVGTIASAVFLIITSLIDEASLW
jgi:type II secretory pathway component PulF